MFLNTSLLKKLEEPKFFDAFIQDNMKVSTYKAEWKDEITDVQPCAAKVYQAWAAEYAAAMVGSVIEKNGEKPTHTLPTAQELVGTIGRMGDEWQMDNDKLDQYLYMEGRYRDKYSNYTQSQQEAEFDKLITFLFKPFERAVIAPHKRIDQLYFMGLFDGKQVVSSANNAKSGVTYEFELGVKKFNAKVAKWGEATATPIDDIQAVADYANSKGKSILKLRMSSRTFRKMCKANQILNSFTLKFNNVNVSNSGGISVAAMNTYLESLMLPTISIEKDRYVQITKTQTANLTMDDRVVFQCAKEVAVLRTSDSVESVDRLPNKTYSTYDDNLVGYWRDNKGRFTDYEMWAQPVFTGINDYFILLTDTIG